MVLNKCERKDVVMAELLEHGQVEEWGTIFKFSPKDLSQIGYFDRYFLCYDKSDYQNLWAQNCAVAGVVRISSEHLVIIDKN